MYNIYYKNKNTMKYIIITGSLISGIGKGITSSSIGLLLQSRGINVTAIKIDPYLNIDAGTMSPFEHGECYVLADGGEVDLDMGNYERFLGLELTKDHNITTGKIYQSVISKERKGEYLGKTVQIVPHITNEIQSWIKKAAVIPVDNSKSSPEVCLIEVGGTIGDIETSPFIEAIRQMASDCEKNQFCFVHVSMIIDNGELKTKPTQHSVAALRTLGIIPNFLVLRTQKILGEKIKKKLRIFCQIPEDNIISNIDMPNIYYVPDVFKTQNICEKISKVLDIKFNNAYQLKDYYKVLNHYESDLPKLNLIMAGKYVGSNDTYLSLIRAIDHASFFLGVKINIIWLNTEDIDKCDIETNIKIKNMLEICHGIIIPGGFGIKGIIGKIKVTKYARINKIPILGICLGLQVMVVEFSHSIGIYGNSTEWDPKTEHPIIDILPGQTDNVSKICRNCFNKITGKTSRVEIQMSNYLDKIAEIRPFLVSSDNSFISIGGCQRYRPDKLYMSNDIILHIECDEHQHKWKNGSYVCDEKRISDCYDEFPGKKYVIIRWNPHKYKSPHGNKKYNRSQRLNKLNDLIKNILKNPPDELIYIYYMFYDKDNHRLARNIKYELIY